MQIAIAWYRVFTIRNTAVDRQRLRSPRAFPETGVRDFRHSAFVLPPVNFSLRNSHFLQCFFRGLRTGSAVCVPTSVLCADRPMTSYGRKEEREFYLELVITGRSTFLFLFYLCMQISRDCCDYLINTSEFLSVTILLREENVI